MKIGIVTTWFERGAAYVSKQFEQQLLKNNDVFIFARGEDYAIGDPKWDKSNVYWSKKRYSPISYFINEKEFKSWLTNNKIELVIFNEQRYWSPILWCAELGVKTVAYVDYYTKETIKFYGAYDKVICNTKKHYQAMAPVVDSEYLPWGTDVDLFSKVVPGLVNRDFVTFFLSAGMNPHRKGADILIKSFYDIYTKIDSKLVIHSQKCLKSFFPELEMIIDELVAARRLEVITQTVSAPGLYHLGDIYVYPSRLDGLGLTVAEAISSGLGILVTNDGPMNEFTSDTFGFTIEVDEFQDRKDGFYWPQAFVSQGDLSNWLLKLSLNKELVILQKNLARPYAKTNLNWSINAKQLETLVHSTEQKDILFKRKAISESIALDEKKYPFISKIHFFYSGLYWLYKSLNFNASV